MRAVLESLGKLAIVAAVALVLWLVAGLPPSNRLTLALALATTSLVFPLVWLGRRILDRHHANQQIVWITAAVQAGVALLLGAQIVRALSAYRDWPGPPLMFPTALSRALVLLTGAAVVLTVANLALKGLGAPFFIVLSRKLAADWMYAFTRNPMVLAVVAFLLCLGIWFQSWLFVLWVLALFTPALLFFVKVYEERELEFRFGSSYLAYRAKTPMLIPGLRHK